MRHSWKALATGSWVGIALMLGCLVSLAPAQQGFNPQGGNQATGNSGGIPAANSQTPAQQAGTSQPQPPLPCPFPQLTPEHEDYLNKLLAHWETSTSQIQRYRCEFSRWDYDPVFGPKPDPTTGAMEAAVICRGEIKYESPDKAMYAVTGKWIYVVEQTEDGLKPTHQEASEDSLEKWISDGNATYEYNYGTQEVLKRQLPPEMKGKTIADGPIPFVFGAKADKTRERYWIRVITPTEAVKNGEYWLEAYPKHPVDSQDFSRVKVILNKNFLVQAVELYAADYDEVRNRKSQTFLFENQKFNESDLNLFKILDKPFHVPSIPRGWKMIDATLTPGVAQGQGPNPGAPASRR